MDKLFSVDGKFYTIMSKVVDLAFVSLLWLVGSLPVVTLLTSSASMYYTVVKCIRYDRGTVFAEFKETYISNLRQGVALTLFYGVLGAVIAFVDYHVFVRATSGSGLFFVVAVGMLILSVVYVANVLWIAPVFSRFSNTFGNTVKLNYVIAMRHLIRSVPKFLVIVAALIVFLGYNELFIILPGLAVLVNSYLSEPALRRYMPEQEEDNGDWRYGFR